jgi:hypothetical protein
MLLDISGSDQTNACHKNPVIYSEFGLYRTASEEAVVRRGLDLSP